MVFAAPLGVASHQMPFVIARAQDSTALKLGTLKRKYGIGLQVSQRSHARGKEWPLEDNLGPGVP